jgi:hypothetical protein
MALPPNIPKKKIPTLLASSCFSYHVDSVYSAAGMYPASASPSILRMIRKPVRLRRKTWKVAIVPNAKICAGIHLSGPIYFEKYSLILDQIGDLLYVGYVQRTGI